LSSASFCISTPLKPPLNNYLAFGKEANCIPALSVEDAKEGVLHTIKGEESHRRHHPDVYADVACLETVLNFPVS
jgi:hypothetical protein